MKDYQNIKVSIYIPTHNRLGLLKKAVDSVLRQTHKNWELIIVADGCTDGTISYCEELLNQDDRIKLVHYPNSRGACYARNQAIKISTGMFVTGLDDDDWFRADRLELFLKEFNKEYSFLCSSYEVLGGRNFGKNRLITLNMMYANNYVGNQVFAYRKSYLDIGGFDESIEACQDYDLFLRLIEKYGNAKQFKARTYVVNEVDANNRITASDTGGKYLTFYNKHKVKLSKRNRVSHILRIYGRANKKLSLKRIVLFVTINFKDTVKHMVKHTLIKFIKCD